jgi:peptidoglycan hydrolase FlgJ
MQINPAQLGAVHSLKPSGQSESEQLDSALKLRDAYRDFIGKTFYGQMLKSMRTTVGKAAYFDGGKTEEVFRSQLDEQLADSMSDSSASQLADPMFRQQFARQAATIAKADAKQSAALMDLNNLRRR